MGVLAGFVLRCWTAATLALNPDEALHLLAVHKDSFADAARASLSLHHPPLLLFLLYPLRTPLFWDEFAARLLFVIAGSLLPVVLYLWLKDRCGMEAAATGALLTALSPNLISLSAQVRSYPFAMLFAALALLWLDRSIARRRTSLLAIAAVFWYLAILADYSVALICPAIALYGVVRLWETSRNGPRVAVWMLIIAGALGVFAGLYLVQVRHFNQVATDFGQTWLRGGFPAPGEALAVFVGVASLKQFAYLAGSIAGGVLLLAAFLYAQCFSTTPAWRLLLVAPFATGIALALLRLLPFGRSRHSAIVSLLIVTGAALAVGHLLSRRPRHYFWFVPAALVLCMVIAEKDVLDIAPQALDRGAMRAAVDYLAPLASDARPLMATAEAKLLLDGYSALQVRPPLPVEVTKVRSLEKNTLDPEIAAFRQRKLLESAARVYLVDGGFFPMKVPAEAGPSRRFGMLRVWTAGP